MAYKLNDHTSVTISSMQDFNQLLRNPKFQGLFSNNCRHLLDTFDHVSVLNTEGSLNALHKIHSGLDKAQWSWFNKMVGHRKDADFTFEAAIGRLQKDPDGTKTRTGKAFQLLKKYNGELKSIDLLKEVYQYGKDNQWGKKGKKNECTMAINRPFLRTCKQQTRQQNCRYS
ncbi:hypothetical protein AVM71_12705 [Piscirickettsia salmonis]|nr:hypothetical protein AVM71_12705 [Piscirickettsia salmonis]